MKPPGRKSSTAITRKVTKSTSSVKKLLWVRRNSPRVAGSERRGVMAVTGYSVGRVDSPPPAKATSNNIANSSNGIMYSPTNAAPNPAMIASPSPTGSPTCGHGTASFPTALKRWRTSPGGCHIQHDL